MDSFEPRLRDRWPIATVFVIFALVGLAIAYMRIGPPKAEAGEIIRFGTRANHAGNQPTVIVRNASGEQLEIVSDAASLKGCTPGDDVRLLRKPHTLEVAPIGCR